MASNVKHVNFADKLDPKVHLRNLAEYDDLKGCVTICLWDDDTITCGWSNMKVSDVALASLKLQVDVMKEASTNV